MRIYIEMVAIGGEDPVKNQSMNSAWRQKG